MWHVIHWQSTGEVQETGNSRQILSHAWHLGKRRVCGKYLKQGTKIVVTGRIQTGSYTNRDGQKVYTTDVVIEEQEFAESKKAAGEQAENAGYTDTGDGFMSIPDGIDGDLPFM